jgi:hypothetical protein
MQHTLGELERTPDSLTAPAQHALNKKGPVARHRHLRLYLYILRGVFLLASTAALFANGLSLIRQNADALGFIVLTFDKPLPFLLIGLWSVVVLVLAALTLTTFVKIASLLTQILFSAR